MRTSSIPINSGFSKLAAAAVCAVLTVFCLFVSKWAFGHVSAVGADNVEVAAFGAGLAPSDPEALYAHASLLEKTLLPADQVKALAEYERAAALSPNHYLYWLAVSRAREQAGDAAGAEAAARRAAALAPNYSRVRWVLGNVLLRAGRQEEAFAELRAAVDADQSYAAPAAAALWQILDADVAGMTAAAGGSPRFNAAIALALASNNRFADAARVWSGIPAIERAGLKDIAPHLQDKMMQSGHYASAVRIATETGLWPEGEVAVGSVSNGGFETALSSETASQFSWTIAGGTFPRVGLNENRKHSGNYSLLVSYGQEGKGSRPVTQRIAVEAGAKYRARFFYMSELHTPGKLQFKVLSPAGEVIASAELSPVQEWKEMVVPFAVGTGVEGVSISISLDDCADERCTTTGSVWFDDFSLERAEG